MDRYFFDPATMAVLEKLRVPFAVYQFINKRVVTVMLSDGLCELFGYDDKEKAYHDIENDRYVDTHPDDVASIASEAFRFATQGGKYEVIYRSLTKNRPEYNIIHAIGEHVYTEDGTRLAYVWYTDEGVYSAESESENKENKLTSSLYKTLHEDSMLKENYYDVLTGLPNMSYFFELAEAWRKITVGLGKTPALLFMDLCGMRYYNRKYGFSEGDKLLRRFAGVLKNQFSNENCSRFNADNFCVYTYSDNLEMTLRSLFAECNTTGASVSLPVRVGIYLDVDGLTDVSTACDRAKYACDTMRNAFVSGFRYFDTSMLEKAEASQYIIDNFEKMLAEGGIQMYNQPIIRTANGRVCDEEALARWNDPERGWLSPAFFIPILEEARLIYKLDLFIVDQIIEKLKIHREEGLFEVPVSVNLSRVDFDACDMVEEIRRRVDDAGIGRDKLIIEVTESSVGKDFDFMKEQIERFRSLGFKVWMDDFGSGYSSLDMLQRIRFDLIKFDMRFMKDFDISEKSRIMLTELIRMAIALGIDTVCEGVETEEQVEFLRMVGCTKMQGYYFCRPIPMQDILERYRKGTQIGFENPDETDYYAAIGKINLYDLAIVSNEDKAAFERYFNTVPMAIFEMNDEQFRMARCNNSFRAALDKLFGNKLTMGEWLYFSESENKQGSGIIKAAGECNEILNKMMVNEELSNGSVVQGFVKHLAVNPVTGTKAIAVVILAVTDSKDMPMTFTHLAKVLSSDYINLFYVNIKNDKYIEYSSDSAVERHGNDFFEASRNDALRLISKKDQELFKRAFNKDTILRAIDARGSFTLSYRLMIDGVPTFVSLKAVKAKDDPDHLVIGVNNVDAQIRQQEALDHLKNERDKYSRIAALSGEFICVYMVDPVTNRYRKSSDISSYGYLALPDQGEDFFAETLKKGRNCIAPEDYELFSKAWTKENILRAIEDNGMFMLNYHLITNGIATPVTLMAALITEKNKKQLIVGVTNVAPRMNHGNNIQ